MRPAPIQRCSHHVWHIPGLYDAAVELPVLHATERGVGVHGADEEEDPTVRPLSVALGVGIGLGVAGLAALVATRASRRPT